APPVPHRAKRLTPHPPEPEGVAPGSMLPNLDFYEPRTAHGSSLSPAIHAGLLARAGRYRAALEALQIAARLDLDDLTGSAAGGVHVATMGGLWQALVYGVAGGGRGRGRRVVHPRPPPGGGGLWAAACLGLRSVAAERRPPDCRSSPAAAVARARALAPLPRRAAADPHRSRPRQPRLRALRNRARKQQLGGDEEMKTVLAALDSSLAGNPVLISARSLAHMLGARVRAVHVTAGDDRTARNVAEAAGVALRVVSGPVVERLTEEGRDDDVTAVVIGARGTPRGRRPLGSTALAVATSLLKPVVVVPPDARLAPEFHRILVPLEGTTSTSLAPRSLFKVAHGAQLDAIALHVHAERDIRAFTDQP